MSVTAFQRRRRLEKIKNMREQAERQKINYKGKTKNELEAPVERKGR